MTLGYLVDQWLAGHQVEDTTRSAPHPRLLPRHCGQPQFEIGSTQDRAP